MRMRVAVATSDEEEEDKNNNKSGTFPMLARTAATGSELST